MAIKKERVLEIMKKFTGCEIYPASFTEAQDCFLAITNRADYKRLVCVTEKKSALFNALQAEREQTQAGIQCKVAPLSGANAEIVRRTIATRGRVLAASRDLLPNRYGAVAVLRFH